ncbi:serine hydrolase [Mucilaginibacter sp.]|uniref:serine hydrolase n=1 Tax=Mucilaginibacter sp. TaxID=1882438 RepID=UPI002614E89C|nr:serine hydrolase [Mucilaginibacter sp.]MDB5032696.1 hypothetical protein [Mucilaginibacter sp.]
MKKILLTALALWPVQTLIAQTTAKKLDSLMNGYTQVHKFNGSVLVAKNGRIVLEKGYGFKNFKAQTLDDANTIYQLASITKQFTSTVILKLIEAHKLALTDKLTKYYPNYPNGENITIYNLLTHTAGIPNYTLDSVFMKDIVHKQAKPLSIVDALIKYNKADFAPGTNWKYSNQGYQLLGEIIEELTKMTYYQAVRKYIFIPLHMYNSGFDFIHLKSSNKATGYYTYPSKNNSQEASIIDSVETFSAGSIYSTIGDLFKWHKGLQDHQIISKASLDQAYTPVKNHYGFGWQIDSLYDKRVISHSGDIWGFKTNIARITDDDVCVILLNNIEDEEMRGEVTRDILSVLYDKPYAVPVKRREIKIDEEILKKYAGIYVTPNFSMEVTIENGQLWIQTTGRPKEKMFAQTTNFFFSKEAEAQIKFENDETGKVDKVTIYVSGRQLEGKKTN